MTSGRPLQRLLSTLGILLLLLSSSGDALGLHRCSHHDALPAADAAQTGSHGHHGHSSAPEGEEESSEGCTCVGTCTISTVAVRPRAAEVVVAVQPAVLHAVAPAPAQPRVAAPDHVLPFANAPPAF